jgi:hypothetical protein
MALVVLISVVLIVGAIAVAYMQYRKRQARIQAVMALAQRVGFRFSLGDADRVVDMPFTLFTKGEKRGIELVITGEHHGVPIRTAIALARTTASRAG